MQMAALEVAPYSVIKELLESAESSSRSSQGQPCGLPVDNQPSAAATSNPLDGCCYKRLGYLSKNKSGKITDFPSPLIGGDWI